LGYLAIIIPLLCLITVLNCWAGEVEETQKLMDAYTELGLEDLMDIKVISAAKKEQKLSDAAAAIFVITQHDIQRSGVTSIPEALRMVPGFHVARVNTNQWSITSRDFYGNTNNRLLILIDGRKVYTHTFSSHYAQVHNDIPLEDVERIEVIRGPGAALWGANAVNGVVNIVTKTSMDTQDVLITNGTGKEEPGFGSLRYGLKLNPDTSLRVYGKYAAQDHAVYASGDAANDEWNVQREGFRMDWKPSDSVLMTLQGDIYKGEVASAYSTFSFVGRETPSFEIIDDRAKVAGGNILLRCAYTLSASSNMALQMYYDQVKNPICILGEDRDSFDLDFQYGFSLGTRQDVLWGLGYNLTQVDGNENSPNSFKLDNPSDHMFSTFVQNEITLIKERLLLMLGSKLEYNDYIGSKIQPNIRFLWTPHERHSAWMSFSYTKREASSAEENVTFYQNDREFHMDRDLGSEELSAFELGYRAQLTERFTIDIATFYNNHEENYTIVNSNNAFSDSNSIPPGGPPSDPSFDNPPPNPGPRPETGDIFVNEKKKTYGIEVTSDWSIVSWWRLKAAYTYLYLHHIGPSFVKEMVEEETHNQFSLRNSMDLTGNLNFDLWVRFVGKVIPEKLKSYYTLDARLGWRLRKDLELSLVGQNLLNDHYTEYSQNGGLDELPTEVERNIYGKITWQF